VGQEKSIGNLRAPATVEETLDRLAAEWAIAMVIIETPVAMETSAAGAS
jgi:hypothetical protein